MQRKREHRDIPPGFGSRVRARRVELRLSQMQVADALAVNQTTVSEWERNQTIPRVDDGLALAKLLGLDIDWLLYGDAHRLSSAPPEAA